MKHLCKITCLIISMAMVLSLAPSSFAGEETTGEKESKVYEHVVMLGIDGAGTLDALMNDSDSNVYKILSSGTYTQDCKTFKTSMSQENWKAILHGMPEDAPSLFSVVRTGDASASLGSFCIWDTFNTYIEDNIDVYKEAATDERTFTTDICNYIKNSKPKLLTIQYDSVDAAGHTYGSSSYQYRYALWTVDNYIGYIYNAYKSAGLLDSTLFIIVADHGTLVSGGHGGDSEIETNVLLGLSGNGVKKDSIGACTTCDVYAIMLKALGYESTVESSSVPSGVTFIADGDLDEDEYVNSNDAIYLLMNTQCGAEDYPIRDSVSCDYNADGQINSDDAIYLLMYAQFGGEEYPLYKK